MATKSKGTKPKPVTVFNCCDTGVFLIHKDFLSTMTSGVKEATPSASKKNFVQFSVSSDGTGGLMKPTVKITHGPGIKERFTFTLSLFVPPAKK